MATAGMKASEFIFDKEYYECENKWVVFPKLNEQDSTHIYGFVYLDREAGFTFRYEGNLNIDNDGKINAVPVEQTTNLLYRIPNDFTRLAILSSKEIEEIGEQEQPEWLHVYTEKENEVSDLVKRGYHYNHIGACDMAIPLLEKAYEKAPHVHGVEFELSYAYNATGKYNEAIELLKLALKNNPEYGLFYRELGYAYIKTDNLKEAEKVYKEGIDISDDDTEKAEMAFNVAGAYWKMKNKTEFKKWAKLVREYATTDSFYIFNLDKMEVDFK